MTEAEEFAGFTLLPADDAPLGVDEDLEAAAASAVAEPGRPVEAEAPEPFGSTWLVDFERGGFVTRGGEPLEVRGSGALEMWCLAALRTQRFAFPVFSDEFGMDDPDALIGEVNVAGRIAEFEDRLVAALLVHDRIAAVEEFEADYDPATGVLTIENFTVVTDEEMRLRFSDLRVEEET